MLELSKHKNKSLKEKVDAYRISTIVFWVLTAVMTAALIVCAVFTKITFENFQKQTAINSDFTTFLITVVFLVISAIAFTAFISFAINFTLLYTHYRKEMIEERKTKK